MTLTEYYIVYPEGECQEIAFQLSIDAIVDLNGNPLHPPLPNLKIIAYRVVRVRKIEERGLEQILHYLELVSPWELAQMA